MKNFKPIQLNFLMMWTHIQFCLGVVLISAQDLISLTQIRIRGSVPVDYGSGYCFLLQWISSGQQKKKHFQTFSATFLHPFSRFIRKSQNCRNQDLQLFYCLLVRSPQHCFPNRLSKGFSQRRRIVFEQKYVCFTVQAEM